MKSKNFSNLVKKTINRSMVNRSQWKQGIDPSRVRQSHITVKLLIAKHKEKILEVAREKMFCLQSSLDAYGLVIIK